MQTNRIKMEPHPRIICAGWGETKDSKRKASNWNDNAQYSTAYGSNTRKTVTVKFSLFRHKKRTNRFFDWIYLNVKLTNIMSRAVRRPKLLCNTHRKMVNNNNGTSQHRSAHGMHREENDGIERDGCLADCLVGLVGLATHDGRTYTHTQIPSMHQVRINDGRSSISNRK